MVNEPKFSFTLVLDGTDPLTPENQDALYEAGCGDAAFSQINGIYYADFDRVAPSFADALQSAIQAVESAVNGLRVLRVEPDEYVSQADIARRLRYKPQSVSQYVHGQRGPGGFPPPSLKVKSQRPLWALPHVVRWFGVKGHLSEAEARQVMSETSLVAAINGLLAVRAYAPLIAEQRGRDFVSFFLREDQRIIQHPPELLEKSKS